VPASSREKLFGFTQAFAEHRQQLQMLVTGQVLITQEGVRANMDELERTAEQIKASTKLIMQRLGAAKTDEEREVQELIDDIGGPHSVLESQDKTDEVAKLLSTKKVDTAPLTIATRRALQTGLDELLEQNQAAFERKLESAQRGLDESIRRSEATILHRLDQGLHELVDDDDVKQMWKKADWRLVVKYRSFGEGVYPSCGTFAFDRQRER
jgi:hypothetical protein